MSKTIKVQTKYGAARLITDVLSLAAWAMIIGGVILFFMAFGQDRWGTSITNFIFLYAGIGLLITGFFALANAQMLRTNIDVADYTRELLLLTVRSTMGTEMTSEYSETGYPSEKLGATRKKSKWFGRRADR